MTMPSLGHMTACSSMQLSNVMVDGRVVSLVKDFEEVASRYMEAKPRLVKQDMLTEDNCLLVKMICTFKFKL
jgi:gamma-glutamyl-gamma-aminobutyrate hydrolase PuuD